MAVYCLTVVQCDLCLSAETFAANGGDHSRRNFWWLRGPSESRAGFVSELRRACGDRPFRPQTLMLAPGQYVLGVGPAIGGIRKKFTVSSQLEMFR